jgi:type II secretory pathway component PulM
MTRYLQQLSQRERYLLMGLAALILLLVIVFVVARPIVSFEGSAKARYAEAVRLEALASDIEAPDARPGEDRGLRSLVTGYADRNQVIYSRVTQSPDGQVRIDLSDTTHRAVFSWLRAMEETEGVVVASASIVPGEATGTLTGQFTLKRTVR